MSRVWVFLLGLSFLAAGAIADDDCAAIIVNHPGVQIQITTLPRWKPIIDVLYSSKFLTPEDGYFFIPRKECSRVGLDPDQVEAGRAQLRKFAVGAAYDLILSKLARVVGTLGGEYSYEASVTYFLSHVRASEESPEIKQRVVADRLFRDLPSLEEMAKIANNSGLDNAETELALARELKDGLSRFQSSLNHPQLDIELQALMIRELGATQVRVEPSRSYALTRTQWSGPYGITVPDPPAVTLQHARQIGVNVGVILVKLDGFTEPRIRPLHRLVNYTAVLEYDRHHRAVIGAALEIPKPSAEVLSAQLKQIQLSF